MTRNLKSESGGKNPGSTDLLYERKCKKKLAGARDESREDQSGAARDGADSRRPSASQPGPLCEANDTVDDCERTNDHADEATRPDLPLEETDIDSDSGSVLMGEEFDRYMLLSKEARVPFIESKFMRELASCPDLSDLSSVEAAADSVEEKIAQWLDPLMPRVKPAPYHTVGVAPGTIFSFPHIFRLTGVTNKEDGVVSVRFGDTMIKICTCVLVNDDGHDDKGDRILYAVRDDADGRDVHAQPMLHSFVSGMHVRVIRCFETRSEVAPRYGFRYDGHYCVEDAFRTSDHSGKGCWKFVLSFLPNDSGWRPPVNDDRMPSPESPPFVLDLAKSQEQHRCTSGRPHRVVVASPLDGCFHELSTSGGGFLCFKALFDCLLESSHERLREWRERQQMEHRFYPRPELHFPFQLHLAMDDSVRILPIPTSMRGKLVNAYLPLEPPEDGVDQHSPLQACRFCFRSRLWIGISIKTSLRDKKIWRFLSLDADTGPSSNRTYRSHTPRSPLPSRSCRRQETRSSTLLIYISFPEYIGVLLWKGEEMMNDIRSLLKK